MTRITLAIDGILTKAADENITSLEAKCAPSPSEIIHPFSQIKTPIGVNQFSKPKLLSFFELANISTPVVIKYRSKDRLLIEALSWVFFNIVICFMSRIPFDKRSGMVKGSRPHFYITIFLLEKSQLFFELGIFHSHF